ncbi:hypothetical protein [Photobacterium leiognathi]|uniref:hypothetical protein n=1 Tax=Photobacterium leiognathi TaxID=553611 RepID=UPI002982784C|nr:hypothetical protein [Photobacterium leiognathi]
MFIIRSCLCLSLLFSLTVSGSPLNAYLTAGGISKSIGGYKYPYSEFQAGVGGDLAYATEPYSVGVRFWNYKDRYRNRSLNYGIFAEVRPLELSGVSVGLALLKTNSTTMGIDGDLVKDDDRMVYTPYISFELNELVSLQLVFDVGLKKNDPSYTYSLRSKLNITPVIGMLSL